MGDSVSRMVALADHGKQFGGSHKRGGRLGHRIDEEFNFMNRVNCSAANTALPLRVNAQTGVAFFSSPSLQLIARFAF